MAAFSDCDSAFSAKAKGNDFKFSLYEDITVAGVYMLGLYIYSLIVSLYSRYLHIRFGYMLSVHVQSAC